MNQTSGAAHFTGLATGLNEVNEIRIQHFTQGNTHEEFGFSLESMRKTLQHHKMTEPTIIYTDKPDQDEAFLMNIFPSLRLNVVKKPLLPCPNDSIEYFVHHEAADIRCHSILNLLKSHSLVSAFKIVKMSKLTLFFILQIVMGLDTEWEYNNEGKSSKVALLQIAIEKKYAINGSK
jgi:hypothetical protein